jgi:hypothetical protein
MPKNGKQAEEQFAQWKMEKTKAREKQLGVRVLIEFTGHINKAKLNDLLTGIRTTLSNHVENGGGS